VKSFDEAKKEKTQEIFSKMATKLKGMVDKKKKEMNP
jgi:hypothetical protein